MVLAPLFAAIGGLLVVAGVMKLRARELVGVAEVALGVAAVVAPVPLVAAVVAVAYAAFAAHSLRLAVVSGGEADCGCFGDTKAPASMSHFALDVGAACVALAAVVAPPRALASLVADSPGVGLVLVAGVAASVYALYLAYTVLPTAWTAFQPGLRES